MPSANAVVLVVAAPKVVGAAAHNPAEQKKVEHCDPYSQGSPVFRVPTTGAVVATVPALPLTVVVVPLVVLLPEVVVCVYPLVICVAVKIAQTPPVQVFDSHSLLAPHAEKGAFKKVLFKQIP